MAKRKTKPTMRKKSGPDGSALEQLTCAVQRLQDEVRMLRDAVEETRDGLQHTLRNGEPKGSGLRAGRRITSFPVDPATADFARRVNRFTPADLPSR